MSGLGIVITAVGVIVGVVIAVTLNAQARQRRTDALRNLAQRLGFRFFETRDSAHHKEFSQFTVFRKGGSRYAWNRLYGSIAIAGRPHRVTMGDYSYTTGSGKNRQTHNLSYCIIELPWRTPALLIRREHIFDRIAGAIGFDDIDFESAEFSRRFFIKGDDKRFAWDVIDPRMIEFLLSTETPDIEIAQGAMCITTGESRWDPPQFERRLRWSSRFLEQWPEHVRDGLAAR